MTDNVISFKNAKKRAGYAAKERTAAQNREKFGRSKAQKVSADFETNKDIAHIDGHKLEDGHKLDDE